MSNEIEVANRITGLGNFLAGEMAGISYAVGFALAFGMNWADKDTSFIGAFFYSLLSWINVGYLMAT